jgi:hypothetical protein
MFREAAMLILAGLLVVGCSPVKDPAGASDAPADSASGEHSDTLTWYADVKPLMEAHCVFCHQEGAVGTFSLDTLESVSLVSEYVADAVQARRMPPWPASPGCEDYQNDLSLTEDQIETIVSWVDGGMVEGEASDAEPGSPPESSDLDRVDFTLAPAEAYTPEPIAGDYRCFAIPWPLDERTYVRGTVFRPGQPAIVHHVIAFMLDGSAAAAVAEAEAVDEQPGYDCPRGNGIVSWAEAEWLSVWDPGGVQGLLPNGVGIPVEPGTIIILQVHYTPGTEAPGPDLTEIDVQVADEVEEVGQILTLADSAWVFGGEMRIPAQTEGVQHETRLAFGSDQRIHSVKLHMHELGKAARFSVIDEGDEDDEDEDCLVDIGSWVYDHQLHYFLGTPRDVAAGDLWRLSCTWDNPTDQDRFWGEATSDEMCLAKVLVSQR